MDKAAVDQVFLTTSIFAGRVSFMNGQWSISIHLSPPIHAVVPHEQGERWGEARIM
jgi:hypothetical protein